jgi:predicted O-methyltransferase YrrM
MDTAPAARRMLDGPRRVDAGLAWHQLRRAIREPRRLARLHYSTVLATVRSLVEPDERRFVCHWFGTDMATVRGLEVDLLGDAAFIAALEGRHRTVRGQPIRLLGRDGAGDHDRCPRVLYLATRLLRPEVVVETGVFDGFSSAFLLKALRDNGRGRLCSVDLPARTPARASTDRMAFDALPPDADPGWIVPDDLRARWTLRLGTSHDLLAPWLAELGRIDLFFHDSLHTGANMWSEYAAAWPALRSGGLLLSDDVFWSSAFWRFARAAGVRGRILRGMGFLRKP